MAHLDGKILPDMRTVSSYLLASTTAISTWTSLPTASLGPLQSAQSYAFERLNNLTNSSLVNLNIAPPSSSNNTTAAITPNGTDPYGFHYGFCTIDHIHQRHHNYLRDACVWRATYHGWLVWTILSSCLILVAICGLLAGLTLAICGLDMTWLHIMSSTGNEKSRKMARAVTAIRRHENWLLCSLIILSVLCNESIPILLGGILLEPWKCIIVSTAILAVFGELLPQVIIPRHALRIGYHFRHFIWFTMWVMAPLSLPVAWVFNRFCNPQPAKKQQRPERGIYNHEELIELIRFHERAEKHGGSLGHDASRIARGALYADNRTIGKETSEDKEGFQRKVCIVGNDDLEKGVDDLNHDTGIFTEWPSVKMVDASEKVDKEFIRKVMDWSYSRILVVTTVLEIDDFEIPTPTRKVLGFFHIRNLVGLKLVKDMVVKDLVIHRVPFVKPNIPLLDMLNVFQVGMSRIAVVCAPPAKESYAPLSTRPENQDTLPRNQAPTWTRKYGLSTRSHLEMASLRSHINWSEVIDIPGPKSEQIPQIPIGIVTYQDVVDTILMKTSRDEYEYFGEELGTHQAVVNLTRHFDEKQDSAQFHNDVASIGSGSRGPSLNLRRHQPGDHDSVESSKGVIRSKKPMEPLVNTSSERDPAPRNGTADTGSLRRRKPNQVLTGESPLGGSPTGFDGTSERYPGTLGLDGANENIMRDFGTELDNTFIISNGPSVRSRSRRNTATHPTPIAEQCRNGSSSYTTNSDGGWHSKGKADITELKSTASLFPSFLNPDDLILQDPTTPFVEEPGPSNRHRTVSMPPPVGEKQQGSVLQTITRYASTSAANIMRLPKLRRMDPFIRDESGTLTKRESEKVDSADYSLRSIMRLPSEKGKRNQGSQKQRHRGSVSKTSSKENSPPSTTMKSLATLVKNRLQMTTESGETISLASTSCYGDLDGADIMAESYMTRRSLQTNRQSLEIAPLFASILNNTPDVETRIKSKSELDLVLPKVYVGMGRGNSKTLPRNFGGTVVRRVREEGSGETDETVVVGQGLGRDSFEIGDDRKGLPSQIREVGRVRGGAGGKGRLGLKRSGSSPWWL